MSSNEETASIVGDLINFRGLVYSPVNEQGVVFLFGKVVEDLNMYVEEIKREYPDCVARRFVGRGWERVYIEFEHRARNFVDHKHNPKQCDIIVCWENNWPDCPEDYGLEIIELKSLIKELRNREVTRPVKGAPNQAEEEKRKIFLQNSNEQAKSLFTIADEFLLSLDESVWRNYGEKFTSYYSPQRVFVYLNMQVTGIRCLIFTGGNDIDGVKSSQPKWGVFRIGTHDDIESAKAKWKDSLGYIRHSVKRGENTGWGAELETTLDDEESSDDFES